MTPKEKAKELVDKFASETAKFAEHGSGESDIELGRSSALICVDEYLSFHDSLFYFSKDSLAYKYWQEVKQEIEKL